MSSWVASKNDNESKKPSFWEIPHSKLILKLMYFFRSLQLSSNLLSTERNLNCNTDIGLTFHIGHFTNPELVFLAVIDSWHLPFKFF